MAYEDKTKPAARTQNLILEDRGRLSVSGVEDVESFDEDQVVMTTSQGTLIVRGSGLHIGKLSLDTGDLSMEGVVTELSYEETRPSGSLWTRLFK